MAKIYFYSRCEWRIIDKEKNEATKKEPILGTDPRIGFFVTVQNMSRSVRDDLKADCYPFKERG